MTTEYSYNKILKHIKSGKGIPRLEQIRFDTKNPEDSFNELIIQNVTNQKLIQRTLGEIAGEMNEVLKNFGKGDDEEVLKELRARFTPKFDELQKEMDILLGIFRITASDKL